MSKKESTPLTALSESAAKMAADAGESAILAITAAYLAGKEAAQRERKES